MDKNAIKKYAVWARRELINRVSQRAMIYGITEQDIGDPNSESVNDRLLTPTEKSQRQALIRKIKEKSYEQVMEEVAYTWFNRFAALRFMEVNGYLPSHVRVFTNDAGEFKPQILSEAIHLELPSLDRNRVYELEDANKTEELFKYLLIVQCNALNSILPGMFQRIEDYTELLLPDYLLREDSVIEQMVTTIPEEDWTDQVQIIGWLYQYYNTELKDKVFADLKKNIKITKENIPAATQLFTPDWIIHYMVENSLGRLWLEGHPNDALKSEWKYYLDEAEQEPEVQTRLTAIRKEYAALKPEEIRVIDPCMGSGHILCVLFDVLVRIYEDYGYTAREAVVKIVENNLWGLDIDDRAAQLAYFSVMMKARQYDQRFFTRKVQPHVYAIHETNAFGGSYKQAMGDFLLSKEHQETLQYLMDAFVDAKEYGSILQLESRDYIGLKEAWDLTWSQTAENVNMTLWSAAVAPELPHFIAQAIALSQKYDVVVTNPPYMAVSNASAKTQNYVKKNFPDSKADLFAVFIERCRILTKSNGYQAMITQHTWMFLSSFEKLRVKLQTIDTVNMAHLGARAFEEIGGEVVQTTSFVLRQSNIKDYLGTYCRLIEPTTQQGKEDMFLAGKNRCTAKQSNFSKIPGSPVAYWISVNSCNAFSNKLIGDIAILCQGLSTTDNNLYVRFWNEVSLCNIKFDANSLEDAKKSGIKWFPFNKGGSYRKWFGNNELVVNYQYDGIEIKKNVLRKYPYLKTPDFVVKNTKYYYQKGLTWSALANDFSIRYIPCGSICADKGQGLFAEENLYYYCALLNSKVADLFLQILSPTLDYNCGYVRRVPCIVDKERINKIELIVDKCIRFAKKDWDAFETSWDFQRHPLVRGAASVRDAFEAWRQECEARFSTLKTNEEELNRIFIDIYGLQDELTPEVEDKDVTVRRADLGRDIRSLISYAVGCMFGRYSLDKPGLIYASGEWSQVYRKDRLVDGNGRPITLGGLALAVGDEYTYVWDSDHWVELSFSPDKDNIIPICDDDYFEDDITGKFIKWVEVVFGKDTLEANLDFIAKALGGKGTPRQIIRDYFLNGFYADHLKIYQKRPIYWLFDSGKKNGFKALIYMHRYQSDTIARIRTDYVHEQQSRYRTAIADLEQRINGASTSERVKLSKQLQKLQAQAEEIRVYEEKIHHLADQMIKIDLDDGVKHNYEIFKDVLAKIK